MKLKLRNPRKKIHKGKVTNNLSTYLKYTKTQFKYYIIGIFIIVAKRMFPTNNIIIYYISWSKYCQEVSY